jgi:hypothetical protein
VGVGAVAAAARDSGVGPATASALLRRSVTAAAAGDGGWGVAAAADNGGCGDRWRLRRSAGCGDRLRLWLHRG